MAKNFFKIATTGPESTGKTAMAAALAEALTTKWVPEFARYYVAGMGRPYGRNDLKWIGLGQKIWEEWYAREALKSADKGTLICDTDWTVLHIWETYRFENQTLAISDQASLSYLPPPFWYSGYGPPENADLYLLCAPDFPWQPDSLREHPDERDILFGMYEELLRMRRSRYVVLSGRHEERLQTALAAIRELF